MPAAAAPAQDGLAALYETQLRNMMEAKPDFSGVDEYQRMVTDPSKAIQQRRMEDLMRREQEARGMLDKRLAGMQDDRPQWLRAIQTAGANVDLSKPLGGLQSLAQAGQTIRQEDSASAEKALELEQAYLDTVNQLRDAGFGLEESMIKADELLFGKREEVRKGAAERRDKGVGETGEEVRSRRTDTTARRGQDIAAETARRGQDITERRAESGQSDYDRRVEKAEQAFSRDITARGLLEQMKSIMVQNNPERMAAVQRQLEAIRQQKYREFGIAVEGSGVGSAGAAGVVVGRRPAQ